MTSDVNEIELPAAEAVLEIAPESDDPVLAALDRAEGEYRQVRALLVREAQDARQARAEAAAARKHLDLARAELAEERRRTARHKDRAARLAAALKDIHKALFSGNVFEMILRASMSLTGATRGVYVSALDDGRLRARAAVDADGYPAKEPSAFLRAVCDRVLAAGKDEFLTNHPAAEGLPTPENPGEAFQNILAAPAVLLKRFHGVVVLADKPGGGFDPEDVELVLSVGDQAGVAVENRQLQEELLRAYFGVVGVLADAIDAKDPYTHGHSAQVARLARRTAARLAAEDPFLRSLCCYGGLLHDVGKIGVSDGVLNKPGKLTPEEWTLMQSHTRIGRDLLAHVPVLNDVAGVVLHHHERYDGDGYPDGLAADRIPLAARIVGVVDAYCAMTSKRSYKESVAPAEARAELVRCRGGHFDPRVVDAFLAVLDDPAAAEALADDDELLPEMAEAGDFHHLLTGRRTDGPGPAANPAANPFEPSPTR